MKKEIFTFAAILSALFIAGGSYACDMHGAGYGGYKFNDATWQTYNPQVSTTDPAFAEANMISPLPAAKVKPKPSFSNAANLAASKAKARLAKKQSDKKLAEKTEIKKTVLNADR